MSFSWMKRMPYAQHMKNGMSMAVRIPASPVLHTYIKLDNFWSVYLFT